MKKRVLYMVMGTLAVAAVALSSCSEASSLKSSMIAEADNGDGTVVTQSRKVGSFVAIRINGSPTVRFVQGDKFEVKVRGGKSYIDKIRTEVEDSVLVIGNRSSFGLFTFNRRKQMPEVYVTAPDLVGVTLDGSGDFICQGPVDTDRLFIMLSGSGDVDFKGAVICDDLTVRLHGSGDIDIDNVEALTSEIELIGSGDMEVSQKNVNDTNVKLIGSGDISVMLKDCGDVNCNLAGSGDMTLRGNIKGQLSKAKAGSGDYHIELSR